LREAEHRRYNSYIRVAKRTTKQIECDGGPVPVWPNLGYLYSYRCIGKVGNLLASAGPLFRLFASSPVAFQYNGHKYEKLVHSAARGRFIAYELSDLSIACRSSPPRVVPSPRSISRQCSILRTFVLRNKPYKSPLQLRYQKSRRVATTYVRR